MLRISRRRTGVALTVVDDGVGLGRHTRRSGLANLRDRAERRGGSLAILSPADPDAPPDRGGTPTDMDGAACHERDPTDVIRVFLLDDHEIVRRGHRRPARRRAATSTVVGEAGTAAEALRTDPGRAARTSRCSTRRLPDGSGIDVCRDIRVVACPDVRCLILTSYDDDDAMFAAVMAGASGYCSRRSAARAWSTRSARSRPAGRCSTRR